MLTTNLLRLQAAFDLTQKNRLSAFFVNGIGQEKKKLGLRFLQTFDKKRCLAYNCVETSGFRVKAKYKVTVCDENHYFFLYN